MKPSALLFLLPAGLLAAPSAFASWPTSGKPECVHEVPIGSHVNGGTGDVTDDAGMLLMHFEPGVCAPGETTMALPHNAQDISPSTYSGWIEGIVADPVNLGGVKAFDQMQVSWYVPQTPTAQDGQDVVFWPGFEMCTGSGGGCPTFHQLIQPVLGFNQDPEANNWTIVAEAVNAGNPNPFVSTPIVVNPGDYITGLMEMVSSTEWLVLISDQGNETYFYWLPNSTNPFNFAQMGILEGYGNALNESGGGIPNCNEYPPPVNHGTGSTFIQFGLAGIAQYDSAWNSFHSTSPAWGAYFGNAPNNCDFSLIWTSTTATLFWDVFFN